jgi:hypothetical protein
MAVDAATQYVELTIESAAARALHEMQQENLNRVEKGGCGDLQMARYREEHAQFDRYMAKQALENFSYAVTVWDSGYHFDDYGQEYWFLVCYDRLAFAYSVTRCNEGGDSYQGQFRTLAEAIACVDSILYPEEVESRPVPDFSLDESTAAGERVIHFHGKPMSIKTIVDQILDEANQGSGQHYEIFARRARSALDSLPHHVTNAEDQAALAKYLAYDRF